MGRPTHFLREKPWERGWGRTTHVYVNNNRNEMNHPSLGCVQTGAITPNIVAPTMFGSCCVRVGIGVQTDSRLFSQVKKSVKLGVRVLRAPVGRVRREKKKRLSPVSLSVFSLVPDLLFDCSRLLEYAKIRTVLQSK